MTHQPNTEKYNTPLAINILWNEIEQRYGIDAWKELKAIYEEASRRYTRANRLNEFRRSLRAAERMPSFATRRAKSLRYMQYCLDNSQDYIDGELPSANEWHKQHDR
jgi:hypothetical protein